jgi:type VI secretion system protein ImpH
MKAPSPLQALARTPRRFTFDAAVRVLTLARRDQDPADVARFRSPPGLTFPAADVLDVRGAVPPGGRPDVTVAMIGLTGPSGVLPRHYTDAVVQALRNRSSSLHAFLDTLSHRFVAFFARAGAKYRPARAAESAALRRSRAPDPRAGEPGTRTSITPAPSAPASMAPGSMAPASMAHDPIAQVLLALTGHGTGHLTDRMLIGDEPLLHYAGLFAMRPRSANRLAALASDFLGMRVEVIEFAGAWLSLPPDQRTRIGAVGQFSQLSANAAAGVRAWDPQARVILRIGPLDRAGFERMLPDRLALQRLVSLVRTFVGFEIGFAINPVLAATAVPPLRLDATADPPPRLGWNTWVEPAAGGPRRTEDAGESVFEAEIIEAQSLAPSEARRLGPAPARQSETGVPRSIAVKEPVA